MQRVIMHSTQGNEQGWLLSSLPELDSYRKFRQCHSSQPDAPEISGADALMLLSEQYPRHISKLIDMACYQARVKEGCPLEQIGLIQQQSFRRMREMLAQKRRIFINSAGGYQDVDAAQAFSLISSDSRFQYHIPAVSSLINLENDPKLEDYTKQHLGRQHPDFSYVLNCDSIQRDELRPILQAFKNRGGYGLWQYTTGKKLHQLYMFIELGIEVGLNRFELHFNAGRNDALDELIQHFQAQAGIRLNAYYLN